MLIKRNHTERKSSNIFNKFAILKIKVNEIKQLFEIKAKAFLC